MRRRRRRKAVLSITAAIEIREVGLVVKNQRMFRVPHCFSRALSVPDGVPSHT